MLKFIKWQCLKLFEEIDIIHIYHKLNNQNDEIPSYTQKNRYYYFDTNKFLHTLYTTKQVLISLVAAFLLEIIMAQNNQEIMN